LRFLFGDYVLDAARRELSRGGEQIALEPQVFDLLVYLLQNRECVVSKDNLLASVWGGRIVSDATLDSRIAAARRAIGDSGGTQTLIRTFARKGVRFVGEVRTEAKPAAFAPEMATESGTAARPRGARSSPPLSIVVLPFTNLSGDPEQEYFADGITDDLTTDLSRISGSFVIARSTAFTYKGKPVDAKQIGHELGVRYVLEGSIRRAANQVRVNTQLIDAETDAHLWADRFDRDIGDLFALQDEITSRIAVALNLELVGAEASRPTEHRDALHHIFRGRAALSMPATPESYAKAVKFFAHALALDPDSVEAQIWLANALASRAAELMTDSLEIDIAHAERLIGQVLAESPRLALAHFAKGQLLRAQGQPQEAIAEFETAVASNRNWVYALYALGQCKFLTGSIEVAIPLVEQAIRLSPRDPYIARWYCWIGRVHLLQSRTDEAIPWLEKARGVNAGLPMVRDSLAAAYAIKGDIVGAATELAEARRLSGDDRYLSIARWKATRFWGVPKIRALYDTIYFPALGKAGMPEE
jgi:TolB-like protein